MGGTGEAGRRGDGARRPVGRRPGESGSRDAILAAARDTFAERGFAGATMRAIAARAGVDPSLIRHFFGSKAALFAAAVAAGSDVASHLRDALTGPRDGIGARVADAYLRLWEDPEVGEALRALIRSGVALGGPAEQLLEAIGASDGAPLPLERVLAGTHLLGVAYARFIAQLPAVAALDHDELVELIAPAIQRYLVPDGASRG
ncbi:TetR/AcrR family transcriptional regulator [Demequina iriomotensis]|uniref:TetR/AcrR family transcriptional regulator n=1 Tax=Demequina iriomotensis TaxID=1536641 RepID=UPI0007805460|nr:TetR/AcrR family transcriptional regulator [Demequina iriomotensis]